MYKLEVTIRKIDLDSGNYTHFRSYTVSKGMGKEESDAMANDIVDVVFFKKGVKDDKEQKIKVTVSGTET